VGHLVLSPVTSRFVPGDFVGGEGDGAQANLDVTGDSTLCYRFDSNTVRPYINIE
jgi:hypothetical protein